MVATQKFGYTDDLNEDCIIVYDISIYDTRCDKINMIRYTNILDPRTIYEL